MGPLTTRLKGNAKPVATLTGPRGGLQQALSFITATKIAMTARVKAIPLPSACFAIDWPDRRR